MIEIEKYNCKDGNELRARERAKYEELKGTLNSYIPNRSRKEHYADNKEQIKEQTKEYYKNNNEKIKEQKKDYYKNNNEKMKEYYKKNKDKISEQKKQKIKCICGITIVKHTRAKHERTKKHLNYVKSQLD